MSAPPLARIRALIAEGYTFGQLASATGLTKGQVAGLVKRRLAAEWAARPHPQSFRTRQGKPPRRPPDPAPVLSLPSEPAVVFTGCRWVCSEGRPWRFCDAPVAKPGEAWCAQHHRIVYHRRAA